MQNVVRTIYLNKYINGKKHKASLLCQTQCFLKYFFFLNLSMIIFEWNFCFAHD